MGGRSSKNQGLPLRIILIGKTGVGKSAVGNTILGKPEFNSRASAQSITKECEPASVTHPREILVVDTPGIIDTRVDTEEIKREILKCIKVSVPGPHVFLLVLSVTRFTKEEQNAVRALQEIFGEKAKEYIIVLFTHGDQLEDLTIIEYVREGNKELQQAIRSCGGRYHVFNNKSKDRTQVVQLLNRIDEMVAANGGQHFSEEMYKETTRVMRERQLRWDSNQIDEHLTFIPFLEEKVVQFQTVLGKDPSL